MINIYNICIISCVSQNTWHQVEHPSILRQRTTDKREHTVQEKRNSYSYADGSCDGSCQHGQGGSQEARNVTAGERQQIILTEGHDVNTVWFL